jgi:hypothetical protein
MVSRGWSGGRSERLWSLRWMGGVSGEGLHSLSGMGGGIREKLWNISARDFRAKRYGASVQAPCWWSHGHAQHPMMSRSARCGSWARMRAARGRPTLVPATAIFASLGITARLPRRCGWSRRCLRRLCRRPRRTYRQFRSRSVGRSRPDRCWPVGPGDRRWSSSCMTRERRRAAIARRLLACHHPIVLGPLAWRTREAC